MLKPDYISIGKRLKEVREKHKVSQTAFGAPIDYGYGYVKNCEHGKKQSIEYIFAVADFYKVSLEWLLIGVDPISSKIDSNKVEAVFDPDLKMIIDVMTGLLHNSDPNLRGWAIITFNEAFAKYIQIEEEKKEQA